MFTKCACHVCVVCLQLDARYKLLNPSAPRGWNPRASPVRYGFNSSNTSRAHIRYVGKIRVCFSCSPTSTHYVIHEIGVALANLR